MAQAGRDRDGGVFSRDPANDIGENGRLALDDEDMSLPWLESDDDEGDDRGAGGGRVAGFLTGALLVLALLVGGVWWLNSRGAQSELLADGSTIEAPEQPYKEAPENPGGKTFAGTGDTSFAVSVGQTRTARLGQNGGAPKDGPEAGSVAPEDASLSPATAGSASPTASATPEPKGVGVQVGAYSSRTAAEAGWQTLKQRSEALAGYEHRIVEGRADIGTVFRLQAVTADRPSAQALCGQLRSAGLSCQVKN